MWKSLVPLFLTCVAAFAADEYEIRMERPTKAGERVLVTGNHQATDVLHSKVDGKVTMDKRVEIAFDYEWEREILAVNEGGGSIHDRAKVMKFSGTLNGSPITQFSSGDVIETKYEENKTTVSVNGKPLTAEQSRLLRAVPKVTGSHKNRDDDVFAPGRKVKVGEEWPINAEAAAKQGAQSGFPGFTPAGIKGKVKLLELTNRSGQPSLRVRGTFEISGKGMALPKAPPEVKVSNVTMTVALENDLPVDPNAIVARTEGEWTLRLSAAGDVEKDGRKLRIEMNADTVNKIRESLKKIP